MRGLRRLSSALFSSIMKSSVNDFHQVLAVIGSRTTSRESLNRVGRLVNHLFKSLDHHTLVVSGGAVTGADYWAKYLCNIRKIPYVEATAFWNAPAGKSNGLSNDYNPGAGHFRNRVIARMCTRMVAFWDGKSPGTGGTLKYARLIGKPVEVIDISTIHPLDQLVLPKAHP